LPEKLIVRRARANSRAPRLLAPAVRIVVAARRRTERERERERDREREREGRVPTTTVALQQCGPATRCIEIPIGCQKAIRLAGYCTTTDYHTRIEPNRTKSACAFRIFQLSRGAPEAEKFRCLAVDQMTKHSATNSFAIATLRL